MKQHYFPTPKRGRWVRMSAIEAVALLGLVGLVAATLAGWVF